MLAAGSLLMAAAVFLLASAGGFRQAMIAALLMSLGGAGVNAAANTLVSTVYGDRRGPMLNVLGVFGAAGAVSVPLAVQRRHHVRSRCTPGSWLLAAVVRGRRRAPPAPAAARSRRSIAGSRRAPRAPRSGIPGCWR